MGKKNNSGQRLIELLDKLKKQKVNTSVKDAIKDVFTIKDDKNVGICIGKIFELTNIVVKEISTVNDHDPDLHLKWCKAVYSGLSSLAVDGIINTFANVYNAETRAYLQACAHELSKHCPDIELPEDEIKKIYDDISLILDDLLKEQIDIDENLKKFIIDKLVLIQDVINNSRVMGLSPLVSVVESAFAGTFLRFKETDNIQELKKSCAILGKYIEVIGKLLTIFEVAKVGYKSLGKIQQWLLQ